MRFQKQVKASCVLNQEIKAKLFNKFQKEKVTVGFFKGPDWNRDLIANSWNHLAPFLSPLVDTSFSLPFSNQAGNGRNNKD